MPALRGGLPISLPLPPGAYFGASQSTEGRDASLAGQSSAHLKTDVMGPGATFAQPLACLRYVPCGGTPGRLCPAEGTWRPLTQPRSLAGKQRLGILVFRDV